MWLCKQIREKIDYGLIIEKKHALIFFFFDNKTG